MSRVLQVPAGVLHEFTSAWFPFGGHLIEGLYRTARSIEATARQRGSLVMLGTLVAGLAHEINNPASAASRAVDALGIAHRTLLASLGGLDISTAQFSALDELRREIDSLDADPDPLGRADREQEQLLSLTRAASHASG
jgi:signal transduction histidine kinase